MSNNSPEVQLEIDTDENLEYITLRLQSENRDIHLGLNIQEAQLLASMLNDAVAKLLMAHIGLPQPEKETRH